MGKKNKNKLPALRNPMGNVMMNMPGLPQLLQDAMPVAMPRPSFDQGPFSLIFTNWKITKLVEAQRGAADIAVESQRQVSATLGKIHEIATFSERIKDSFEQYGHASKMRMLDEREKIADIFIKEAQAQQIGYEVKLSELDYNIRLKQFKKMEEDDTIDV